jgi:hypothetical protein
VKVFFPISIFNSELNGNNYYLDEIVIDTKYHLATAFIENLYESGVIKNLNLIRTHISGRLGCSGLVNVNNGLIDSVHIKGSVSSRYENARPVSGIAYWNEGIISNSSFDGDLEGKTVGGLVSFNEGIIKKSFFEGTITGARIGGITGTNDGTISKSYAKAKIEADSAAGGIALNNSRFIENSYFIGAVETNPEYGNSAGIAATTDKEEYDRISNCYSSATLTGSQKFGVAPEVDETNISFFNSDLAPVITGGTPANTQELKTKQHSPLQAGTSKRSGAYPPK